MYKYNKVHNLLFPMISNGKLSLISITKPRRVTVSINCRLNEPFSNLYNTYGLPVWVKNLITIVFLIDQLKCRNTLLLGISEEIR